MTLPPPVLRLRVEENVEAQDALTQELRRMIRRYGVERVATLTCE